MTSTLLWTLIAVQVALGGFDTLYHHELTERLAWRPSQRRELKLHGVRNLIYGALFATLGWSEVHGALAWAVIAFLGVEIVITLADFVEEDGEPQAAGDGARDAYAAGAELRRDPGAAAARC